MIEFKPRLFDAAFCTITPHHLPATLLPFCDIIPIESITKEVTIIRRRIITFTLTFIIIFGLIAAPMKANAATASSTAGIVNTSSGSLNVRSSASTNGSVVKKLSDGSYVTLISKSGAWWYVEYGKNQYGWCHSSYINIVNSTPRTVYTSSGSLNVRSGAGTSYAKTGSVASGETVLVLSSSGYWSRILYHGTKTGYVYNTYLGSSSSGANAAVSLSVPSYKQYDSRWANVKIGSYGKTMRQIGCATTALAMMESYRTGTTITPADMTYRVGYTASGSIYWPSNYTAVTSSTNYLSKIYSILKSGKPVLLGLKNSYGSQHWVVVCGFNGGSLSASNFTIRDPGSSWRSNLQQVLNSYPSFYKYFFYN